jgi:23S rRNA pseudouridine1911/1915/1917 synthase
MIDPAEEDETLPTGDLASELALLGTAPEADDLNEAEEEESLPYEALTPEEALRDTDLKPEDLPFSRYLQHQIVCDPGQLPLRLDVFLTNRMSRFSRSRIKLAAGYGLVRVNGKRTKVNYKVRPQDRISIILPYPRPPETLPEEMPLTILYEDSELLVLDKPAGLVCHPGVGNHRGTLINGLVWHCNHNLLKSETERSEAKPALVHRIDKDTSGLLVVAKSETAYHFLARQFAQRTTDREYLALVWGDVKADSGTIDEPIGRNPSDRKKYMVVHDETGKPSVTHYRVVLRFGFVTLVRCKLQTGRTHQIRVHFKHLGHTLFNDAFYGGDRMLVSRPSTAYRRFLDEAMYLLPRQALHARTLGFIHPATQEQMLFQSPLPSDFSGALRALATYTQIALPDDLLLTLPD